MPIRQNAFVDKASWVEQLTSHRALASCSPAQESRAFAFVGCLAFRDLVKYA